jgi:hypothetical protein
MKIHTVQHSTFKISKFIKCKENRRKTTLVACLVFQDKKKRFKDYKTSEHTKEGTIQVRF